MDRQICASLFDSGPVAFDSGGLAAARGEFPHAIDALSAAGATLVSLEPPMWVHDGCEEVADFVRFAEAEIASGGQGPAWARLDNPGAYGVQERFGIPKADADGLRAELEPLNSLVRRLTGSQRGLLEAATGWDETAPVKRYRQGPGDELLEIARIGSDRVLALERVHVDRRRDADDDKEGYRNPMRLTLIVSYDEAGGTYFPYAELLQKCPGVEPLPTILDERSTRAEAGGETAWPAERAPDRGVLVRGRRGRLLVFASSSADPKVPLYSSLHQGVLIQPADAGAAAAPPPRMVSVIGACGGGRYETSAFHECLEHETIENRAHYWGRTPEEEAAGILMTQNSTRRGEAWAWLERRAEVRRTTIDALISQELARHPHWSVDRADTIAQVVGEEEDPDAPAPRIFWREHCTICLGGLMQPNAPAAADALVPGYMSCGHVLCKECHEEIARRIYRGGRGICPECRELSRHKWRPLIVEGKWAAGDGAVEAGAPAPSGGATLQQPPTPSSTRTVEVVRLQRCGSQQRSCTVS